MPTKPHGGGHGVRLPKNGCFACGPDNAAGMHLKFTFDEQRRMFVCRFRLDQRYTGPPGHCHGGIIATILDEAMGKTSGKELERFIRSLPDHIRRAEGSLGLAKQSVDRGRPENLETTP